MNSNKEQVADAIDKLMFQNGELKSHDAVTMINLLTKLLKETEKHDSSDDESSDDESGSYIAAMHRYESQRTFTLERQIAEQRPFTLQRQMADDTQHVFLNARQIAEQRPFTLERQMADDTHVFLNARIQVNIALDRSILQGDNQIYPADDAPANAADIAYFTRTPPNYPRPPPRYNHRLGRGNNPARYNRRGR